MNTRADNPAPDIQTLQQEVERLREVESRFEEFANTVRDFAFITLDLNYCIVGWNKGAEMVIGYTEAEILGRPGKILFTGEDVALGEADKEMATALATGRAEDERWHVRKDGSRFWGSGVLTLLRDGAGKVRGFAKVMRDYTEQRQRMEALKQSEARFRLLVDNIRDCAVFPVDLEGKLTDWNPGAEATFGYTATEAVGHSALDLFAADEHSRSVLRNDLEIAAKDGGAVAEAWMVRKGGARFYARWVTNAMRNEAGELVGFTKVLMDETERKRSEEDRERQFQRDRELLEGQVRFTNNALHRTKEELEVLAGQLLSAQDTERRRIARDLHDHLAQRLALVELKVSRVREQIPNNLTEVNSELDQIQEQLSHLSDQVRDISHHLHPSTIEHIGIVPALRHLIEEIQPYRKNKIELDSADFFEEGISPEIRGVIFRISEEALRNVQRHAGDVPVTVALYRSPNTVHLEIQDEGPGFSHEAIEGKRTLGLISMLERARLLEGNLVVTSAPGNGAKVELTVPVGHKQVSVSAGA